MCTPGLIDINDHILKSAVQLKIVMPYFYMVTVGEAKFYGKINSDTTQSNDIYPWFHG